jgi:hypothetical protein
MLTADERRERIDEVVSIAETYLHQTAQIRELYQRVCKSIQIVGSKSPIDEMRLSASLVHPSISNVLELSALFRAESACLIEAYWSAEGFRKALFARTLALVGYESTLTFKQLLGKKFRETAKDEVEEDVDARLRDVHKSICLAFDEIKEHSGELRNNLAAHRSLDSAQRYELATRPNSEAIIESVVALYPVLNELATIMSPYLGKQTSNLAELARMVEVHLIAREVRHTQMRLL